jgi:hypothetical protein
MPEFAKARISRPLKRLQFFINRFGFLYQCYKLEATDLDSVLFTRDAGPFGMVLLETHDTYPSIFTNSDHLWEQRQCLDLGDRALDGTAFRGESGQGALQVAKHSWPEKAGAIPLRRRGQRSPAQKAGRRVGKIRKNAACCLPGRQQAV